jgi:anti-sigma regulatory factor (Ser/Thr protein kinase)
MTARAGSTRDGGQAELTEAAAARPAPALTRSHTFLATADQARPARQFLAATLNGSALTGDALICLSELVTNSICHSNSARPGGAFTVRARLWPGLLRVEAEDEGAPWAHGHHDDGQSGRGLLIVSQLATAWGISGNGATSRTVWFEMTHP